MPYFEDSHGSPSSFWDEEECIGLGNIQCVGGGYQKGGLGEKFWYIKQVKIIRNERWMHNDTEKCYYVSILIED